MRRYAEQRRLPLLETSKVELHPRVHLLQRRCAYSVHPAPGVHEQCTRCSCAGGYSVVFSVHAVHMQGVHRVGVGDSRALPLATLAPLPQDDLVRVGVKVREGVSSYETTHAYEQQDCNVCAKAVPVINYGGAL